jgi:hypothetical protein
MENTHIIFLCLCVCCLNFPVLIEGASLDVYHVWQPEISLFYAVNPSELQRYIEPRFKVSEFKSSAYIGIEVANVSTPGQPLVPPFFPYLGIFTFVEYQSTRYLHTLFGLFSHKVLSTSCELYQSFPLGCKYSPDIYASLNNKSFEFSFNANYLTKSGTKDINASLTLDLTWDLRHPINYVDISELSGWLFTPTVYAKYVEATSQILPVFHGEMLNLTYDSGLFGCTVRSLASNFISSIVGSLPSMNENNPTFCGITPKKTATVTPATP